jgi:LPXTG-motif cell wall-anchored protein
VTVTVTDDEGNEVTDSDDATVRITEVTSVINQNLNQTPTTTGTTSTTTTETLPRTGASSADLATLAAAMLVLGGLLMTGSRWAPVGPAGTATASALGAVIASGRRSLDRLRASRPGS